MKPSIILVILVFLVQILSRTFLNATPAEGVLIYFASLTAFTLLFIADKEAK
jgi:hypothetical protein